MRVLLVAFLSFFLLCMCVLRERERVWPALMTSPSVPVFFFSFSISRGHRPRCAEEINPAWILKTWLHLCQTVQCWHYKSFFFFRWPSARPYSQKIDSKNILFFFMSSCLLLTLKVFQTLKCFCIKTRTIGLFFIPFNEGWNFLECVVTATPTN